MEENNLSIVENFYGENLTSIWIDFNTDILSGNDTIISNEISFLFNDSGFTVKPIFESDEIQISLVEDLKLIKGTESKNILSNKFQSLDFCWQGINSRGYFDVLLLSFDYLIPSIAIVSQMGVLELYEITPFNKTPNIQSSM